jgi:hypothetical protein
MIHYRISSGNPEGTDWTFDIDHKKHFTEDQFNEIIEEAFVFALEKESEKEKCVWVHSINPDYVYEYLISKGFIDSNIFFNNYYFSPFWAKNNKLSQWFNRKKFEDLPDYLKENKKD